VPTLNSGETLNDGGSLYLEGESLWPETVAVSRGYYDWLAQDLYREMIRQSGKPSRDAAQELPHDVVHPVARRITQLPLE
jgi:hypothetical protein